MGDSVTEYRKALLLLGGNVFSAFLIIDFFIEPSAKASVDKPRFYGMDFKILISRSYHSKRPKM